MKQRILGTRSAFTIVELLIVVVVIAILAAITIVAYNGITNQAKESALKSDLTTTAKKAGLVQVETGTYPSAKPSGLPEYIQYSQTSSGQGFCATASKEGKALHITQEGTIQIGVCSGHTATGGSGGGGDNEIATNSPIQNVTPAQCAALPTFTGSNDGAVRTVTDSRGGTARTYEIAKLADDNCWMLTNLRLGSTDSEIVLTGEDTNLIDKSDFILPRIVYTKATDSSYGSNNDYDNPYAIGPVPGDTTAGSTNYGYLYNWSAASAGATRSSNGYGSNAANSICPAGWRLPTGNGEDSELAMLNAKMNNPSATTGMTQGGAGYDQNWQYTGPFRGVFAGSWWGAFNGQGSEGPYWTRSTSSSNLNLSNALSVNASSDVRAGSYATGRTTGLSIRCIAG